jgi:hypothetical protein
MIHQHLTYAWGGNAPGAGAELTWTLPADGRWRCLTSWVVRFQTGAAIANRYPQFYFQIGGLNTWYTIAYIPQVASTTQYYDISPSPGVETAYTANTVLHVPIPPRLWLPPGCTIFTSTVGIQAADQYTSNHCTLEEWL